MSELAQLEEQYLKLGEEIETLKRRNEIPWDKVPLPIAVEVRDLKHEQWRPRLLLGYQRDREHPFITTATGGWRYCRPAPMPWLIHTGGTKLPVSSYQMVSVVYRNGLEVTGNAAGIAWEDVLVWRIAQ